MTIQCYAISDDPRNLNKNLGNAVVTLTGVRFKDDTSILRPVLDVAYNEDLFGCNYLHIGVFNRFYFIKNITTTNNRLYLECEVDVLYSYRQQIQALTCVVSRQENKYNTYLNDGVWRNLQPKEVITLPFTQSFYRPCNFILTVGGEP